MASILHFVARVRGKTRADLPKTPHVIRRPQNLFEAQMVARLAAVVVCVNEIDPKTLQASHTLSGRVVVGPCGADLGVVQGNRREEDARAVEIEVPAIDPELSKSETHGKTGVQHFPISLFQGDVEVKHVPRRMDIPELLRLPMDRRRLDAAGAARLRTLVVPMIGYEANAAPFNASLERGRL